MKVLINREQLQTLLPHAGCMSLLNEIVHWDQSEIVAKTQTHLDENNPLRFQRRLSATIAIEYASQAIAVHGSLVNAQRGEPRQGMIGSLINVTYDTTYLDDKENSLLIYASVLQQLDLIQKYHFKVCVQETILISGDILVILQ